MIQAFFVVFVPAAVVWLLVDWVRLHHQKRHAVAEADRVVRWRE